MRRILGILFLLVASAGLALVPHLLWRLRPSHPLAVLIVDKTVPTPNYREHKGLMWLLNYGKFSGQTPLAEERDYVGVVPLPDGGHVIRPIPEGRYDLVYVADTYGVYRSDLEGESSQGQRSELVYGGLGAEDIKAIEGHLQRGAALIAEFNTFASPTATAQRESFTRLLGLEWSGWVGRYFEDLSLGEEAPVWLVENYERQYGERWKFGGPGFALVREDDQVVVLAIGKEVGEEGLRVVFAGGWADRYGATDGVHYTYWFDIVAPLPGTEVIAEYVLDLTPAGEALLAGVGIPLRFPAVLKNAAPIYTAYYFAGDFADSNQVPWWWRLQGLAGLYRYLTPDSQAEPAAFYWKVYVPMMQSLLGDLAARTSIEDRPRFR